MTIMTNNEEMDFNIDIKRSIDIEQKIDCDDEEHIDFIIKVHLEAISA